MLIISTHVLKIAMFAAEGAASSAPASAIASRAI
jgi:hypothetical protein